MAQNDEKTDHTVLVAMTIKATSQDEAEKAVSAHMGSWFDEFIDPYPSGTLLHWNFYKPVLEAILDDNDPLDESKWVYVTPGTLRIVNGR